MYFWTIRETVCEAYVIYRVALLPNFCLCHCKALHFFYCILNLILIIIIHFIVAL